MRNEVRGILFGTAYHTKIPISRHTFTQNSRFYVKDDYTC
jgi:hypothetical protein